MKRVVECRVVVPDKLAGRRLDAVLAEMLPDFSRSLIKKWIENGQVFGKRARSGLRVCRWRPAKCMKLGRNLRPQVQ